MKEGIRLLLSLLFVIFFVSNSIFAGGPEPKVINPWVLYMGGFGGSFGASFTYGGTYFATVTGSGNQLINNDTFQHGVSGGGQVGLQYHFHSRYYTGLVFSIAANANRARLATPIDSSLSFIFFTVNHEF